MRSVMRSAWSSTMRKNCTSSAARNARRASSTVAVAPLMEVSGTRSSWLTMPRKSARMRSSSSSGARFWSVTTTVSTPPSPCTGVALSRVATLGPSGTESTISSARTRSALRSTVASGNVPSASSLPSARRQVITSRRSSVVRPGWRRRSTMRLASRLSETRRAVAASNTATPTGQVSTRASRSARARRSSRKARALAMATAACAANSTSSSSSSAVKRAPPAFSASQKLPTCSPRWRIGVPWKVRDGSRPSPSRPSAARCEGRSARRMGPGRSRRRSNSRGPSGHSSRRRCSASLVPRLTKSWSCPSAFTVATAP